MVGVISFSKDKHEKFDRYPKCFGETKYKKLRDAELDFGEVLNKAINNENTDIVHHLLLHSHSLMEQYRDKHHH